ncbi:MAG TPA: hypothetical protein VED17_06060 [Nitrososphaerales archaeon]|nr:hypothetical protein [Nitrososphaerales archaeon]
MVRVCLKGCPDKVEFELVEVEVEFDEVVTMGVEVEKMEELLLDVEEEEELVVVEEDVLVAR